MSLGNANTSAQARGKAKPVMVKRRKEVVAAKGAGTITATLITGADTGSDACGTAISFDQTYYLRNGDFTGEAGSYIPNGGTKIYTRPRINDKYALTEGLYKFKVGETDYLLDVASNLTARATICR
tara:strand:- start:326 stop:703 length:378 start_codon:yes stop_codon:yes gene_type:complete